MELRRYHQSEDITLGILSVEGLNHPIYTLELPWKNNQQNISCIPEGKYKVAPYSSQKYKNVYEIQNVPGRTKILFHLGNYLSDTRGCILPGLGTSFNHSNVMSSLRAMDSIRGALGDKETTIEITNIML